MIWPAIARVLAALTTAVMCAAAGAAAAGPLLVPGRMGYNALPALRNVDPVIGDRTELELSATAQLAGLGSEDVAGTPYVRLTVPFREVAALELDGTPFELFRTSAATEARLGARVRSGASPGDLRAGARFLVLEERGWRPALGLRLVVKSTSGKDRGARRFTNAPGYVFDLLGGKDLGAAGPVRLRALAKLGFLAWQVADGRQDDALDYGATLRAGLASGVALSAEWRGYAGWRGDDRPMVLGLTADVPAGQRVLLRASAERGLTADAPPLDVRFGVVLFLDAPMARDRAAAPADPRLAAGTRPRRQPGPR
ncbi:hypothetical protein [Anaeromyxobacter sp. PSR-1]|uniref:hypothetical protein n=1 Tax=Anaeromyxobacter sp. PSR-1 TaxID=1300915 RepID=UPI0005E9DF97|nr:hypothetical protein [Anaeromyxobacter sp. PSR-1]GAO03360.1 hypothetical protein PSR1_02244 [Anaeromyxobacter sp. PSR-1]